MTQLIDDFFSWAIPKSLKYAIQEIKDDITDLTLSRKVYRNIFRLSTSGSAIIISALLPTVIAPHTLGHYLNDIFATLLNTENVLLLDTLSVLLCGSILGSATLIGSKELYRLFNKRLHGHTNSDYNFDKKRIQEIAKRYIEQYQNIRPELIEKKVKADINYMLTQIKEKRTMEEELSKTIKNYKKNPKHMEIISPKDPISKADIKLMLALYIHGDDRAFKAHLSLYPKVQTLYIEHYTKPALEMYELASGIESRYPTIAPAPSMQENAAYLRKVGRRENIAPSMHISRAYSLNIFGEEPEHAIRDIKDHENDGPYLEEISIYGDSDDEKHEEPTVTNPLNFIEPYVQQQTLEKRRASFRPTIQPRIDEAFARELHHDIDKVLEKMKNAVEQADQRKMRVQRQKRKTI